MLFRRKIRRKIETEEIQSEKMRNKKSKHVKGEYRNVSHNYHIAVSCVHHH